MYFIISLIYLSILSTYGYAASSTNLSEELFYTLPIVATISIQKTILSIPGELHNLGLLTHENLLEADSLVVKLLNIAWANIDKEIMNMDDFFLALKNYDDFLLNCAVERYIKLHPDHPNEIRRPFISVLITFWLMTEQLDIRNLIVNEQDEMARKLVISPREIKNIEDKNITQLVREVFSGYPENVEEYFAPSTYVKEKNLQTNLQSTQNDI